MNSAVRYATPAVLLAVAILGVLAVLRADEPALFVGKQTCTGCHEKEAQLWQGSHHEKAMQEANDRTVLGDFKDANLTHFGVTSTFYRKGDKFVVRTDGPDGKLT